MEKDNVLIKSGKRFIVLDIQSIDMIRASSNKIWIYCGKASYLVREGLGTFFERLPKHGFFRINRSVVINIRAIREIRFKRPFNLELTMRNNQLCICTRSYRNTLCEILGITVGNCSVFSIQNE